ncbi:hypothetical protein Tco_1402253 [Tanacetum coccineum]
MALESSSQQPKQITPASNVNLECDKDSTNTITFTFSNFDKPLSFNLDEFSSITGLKYSKNYLSIPPKEMVRTGLAILRLFNEKNPELLSTDLVNFHFFQIPSANEVALIPHMLKVAKISNVPEKTLILPFRGVNDDDTADKSLSGTVVQSVTQLKASTDKKSKRKKNPSSSGPKTFKIVKESSKKKVAATQLSEESVATADATKSLEASVSAEELRNQPKPADAEKGQHTGDLSLHYKLTNEKSPKSNRLLRGLNYHPRSSYDKRIGDPSLHYKFTFSTNHLMHVHETIVEEVVKDSGITSLGNVTFEELYGHDSSIGTDESPFDTKSEIKFTRKEKVVQAIHDDAVEITLIGSSIDQEMHEADYDLKSMPDDEIMSVSGNKEEDDDSEKLYQTDEIAADNVIDKLVSMANTGDATKNVYATSHLHVSIVSASSSAPKDVQALIAKDLWEKKNIPRGKIPNVQTLRAMRSIPKAVSDAIAQQLPYLLNTTLIDTLQKILLQLLKESVKKALPKEFNALNELESRRWSVKYQMQLIQYLEQMVHSTVQIPRDILVVNAKQLQIKVEKNAADIHEQGEKESQVQSVPTMEVSAPTQGEQHSTKDVYASV